jgi:predicted small lipoprotein YifL
MPYLLLVGAVVLLVLILSGCGSKGPEKFADPVPAGAKGEQPTALTRADLQKRLEALAKTPAPKELKPGASCYSVHPGPESVTYICPTCSEKTVYGVSETDEDWWMTLDAVHRELPRCRPMLNEIKGVRMELDESQFCRKCSPDVKKPRLVLIVKHPGEAQPHRCVGVRHADLRLIREFLEGKTKGIWDNDSEYPLKDCTKRLGELLGVKVNDTGAPK